jgi:hypothetical protein
MKEINEMTKQEINDIISKIEEEERNSGGFLDQIDIEMWIDLHYVLTHNFPHLIGGKE